jgi:hypothetical protein
LWGNVVYQASEGAATTILEETGVITEGGATVAVGTAVAATVGATVAAGVGAAVAVAAGAGATVAAGRCVAAGVGAAVVVACGARVGAAVGCGAGAAGGAGLAAAVGWAAVGVGVASSPQATIRSAIMESRASEPKVREFLTQISFFNSTPPKIVHTGSLD